MDLLVKRGGKAAKRIFLVTNAGGEVKEEEDIKIIISQLEAKNVKLNVMYATRFFRFTHVEV
jgi:hypothetical protein